MDSIKGGCRCGQLRYELNRPPVYAGYCHCTDCRSRNSSPCTALMFGLEDSLIVSGSCERYSELGGSGSTLEHFRCVQCGSTLYSRAHVLRNIVAIPAATLDDASIFKPVAHAWVRSKEPWLEITDGLPQYPGPPELPRTLLE
jgi:hypothetical protein